MSKINKYHWNKDTLDYFHDLYNESEDKFYNKIIEFVKYECDLEDGETYEDLMVDLIEQSKSYQDSLKKVKH